MNINIREIVEGKIAEMEASGVVEKALGDGIEKMILKGVSDALNGWDLNHQIKELVEKQVSEVVSDIGFTAYNTFIANTVKNITEGVLREDIANKIKTTFDNLLVKKRESIKLSEVFEAYRKWLNEDVDAEERNERGEFYVKLRKPSEYSWFDVELNEEEPKYSHSSIDIKFTVFSTGNKPGLGYIDHLQIEGKDLRDKLILRYLSDFESLLINLAYNQTPVEIDIESEDDIDNSYDTED